MGDLIERLNRCAEDCDIYSSDQCATLIDGIGHIAMRHLLRESAAALEAAREDARRWRERYTAELACSRMELHGDTNNEAIEHAERTAERIAAIDQSRGEGVAAGRIKRTRRPGLEPESAHR